MNYKADRYYVSRFGRYNFIIVDSQTNLAVRKKGKEHITNIAYDEDGPVFLVFNKLEDAKSKCEELNCH